jgi:hypothetical protein
MNRFPFAQYAYISKYHQLADKLIEHWNKHLKEERKIK